MIESHIERYEQGADAPGRWIEGLSDAELDSHPVKGTWSVRQLVVHMLDSDLAATHRMRRIVAENLPLIIGYNETAFAQIAPLSAGDLKVVTNLFALNRRWTASFLRALPAEAFARKCVHNERGTVTLEEMVKMYAGHVPHHEPFLRAKRQALGKTPLAV